ncbi:ABC-three component system protein [Parachryseolinea silvisoli]|uniref:ABC-three component system protein n=1 Tax=Parachryseolinea silvisoli TaxID=2873601 RepID=UPI002265AFD4|nr:ABC-three component system protein [Parachryseolinea silvisoli]MCD9015207.1 restriction endonuclease [Parachryseolinea silvisoli]
MIPDIEISDVTEPVFPEKRLSTLQMLTGAPINKLDRVRVMSPDEFEDFVRQWVWGHLTRKYRKVRNIGGAGDKGRDVIGYINDTEFEMYQCKHYVSTLAPSHILVELGKLCYHTFQSAYSIPKKYFIVSPHGPGPSLTNLLENPQEINDELIKNWEKQCKGKITNVPVELTGDFLEYVKKFDFSIIEDVDILTVIAEHSNTIYHAATFGGGLKRFREVVPEPAETIEPRELVYVGELYKVYSETLNTEIKDAESLKNLNEDLHSHFYDQRKSFYCAESLEVFSRENFSQYEVSPFDELKSDAFFIIKNELTFMTSHPGSERLTKSIQAVSKADFSSNPLTMCLELRMPDRAGMCHHMANENKVRWTIK